jgi:hypothetical protein
MELPDEMPDGCNFYGLLQTTLTSADIAQRFVKAGWRANFSEGSGALEVAWGRLTLTSSNPIVVQGWVDQLDNRLGEILEVLGGRPLSGYQWITSDGQLWREIPFDESMLDPNDPRLPTDLKEYLRASGPRAGKLCCRIR